MSKYKCEHMKMKIPISPPSCFVDSENQRNFFFKMSLKQSGKVRKVIFINYEWENVSWKTVVEKTLGIWYLHNVILPPEVKGSIDHCEPEGSGMKKINFFRKGQMVNP
jgi:hypothetical protein